MERHEKGQRIGIAGLLLLLASWLAIYLAGRVMPNTWAPNVWLITLTVGLPSALIAGIVAGRMASRWWYFVSGVSCLTAGVLLAGAAV